MHERILHERPSMRTCDDLIELKKSSIRNHTGARAPVRLRSYEFSLLGDKVSNRRFERAWTVCWSVCFLQSQNMDILAGRNISRWQVHKESDTKKSSSSLLRHTKAERRRFLFFFFSMILKCYLDIRRYIYGTVFWYVTLAEVTSNMLCWKIFQLVDWFIIIFYTIVYY